MSPERFFHRLRYLRSNARRLEHLASLGLDIYGKTVLDVGAGIGDLTSFFLDRDCTVTSVEPRAENVEIFRARYTEDPLWPQKRLRIVQAGVLDMHGHDIAPHQIVFCYGVLNEMEDPDGALASLARNCAGLLILESAVSSGVERNEDFIQFSRRNRDDPTASISGGGCLPTRLWLLNRLKGHFAHVYMTRTQPFFDRYRSDWREPSGRGHDRVLFIASRHPLENGKLTTEIPDWQPRSD